MTDRTAVAVLAYVGQMLRRKHALAAAVLVAAPVGAFAAARVADDSAPKPPTLAQLAAKNYRTLSAAESRRLLDYAESEYRCVRSHGAPVAAPVASRTRIRMAAGGQTARELLAFMTPCEPKVGPPPPGASLQARDDEILVYLPKRCLLDPNELTTSSS